MSWETKTFRSDLDVSEQMNGNAWKLIELLKSEAPEMDIKVAANTMQ